MNFDIKKFDTDNLEHVSLLDTIYDIIFNKNKNIKYDVFLAEESPVLDLSHDQLVENLMCHKVGFIPRRISFKHFYILKFTINGIVDYAALPMFHRRHVSCSYCSNITSPCGMVYVKNHHIDLIKKLNNCELIVWHITTWIEEFKNRKTYRSIVEENFSEWRNQMNITTDDNNIINTVKKRFSYEKDIVRMLENIVGKDIVKELCNA